MAILSFATGAIDPAAALSKGLPFYRIRQNLVTPAASSDFFNINAPIVAAYVGPDSDFDRYSFSNLTALFGTRGGSAQVFTSKQHWCPRVLVNDAPNVKLAGAGFVLGFDAGDAFDLAAQPFLGLPTGAAITSYAAAPVVDVYLWLVEPPHPPFARNRKWYQVDDSIALVAGVETPVLIQPTWGRKKLTLKTGTGATTTRTYNVYGAQAPTITPSAGVLVATVVLASTDPAEEIVLHDWSWNTVLVTETAAAGPDNALRTRLFMED